MYKIGIIGCGKITEVRHAPEYAENPNCELVAFFDLNPARAQLMADTYGGQVCASIEQLLAMDLDAVSVCVANANHAQVSIQALEAGKHVLCEKPMAVTAQECEAMLEAEKRSGKMLMIGQSQRMSLAHQKARALLQGGEIGELVSFRLVFGHPGPEAWTGSKNSWFFNKKIARFGAMADLGVHKTDLLHYLTGQKVVSTSAVLTTADKKYPDGTPIDVDDNAYCIYTLANGVVGTMHVSWTFYGEEDNSTILYGTKGRMRIYNDPKYALIVEKTDGTSAYYILDAMTSNEDQTSGKRTNTGVIDAFIKSLETGEKLLASGEEGAAAMHVIFANELSSQERRVVDIDYNK